MICRLLVEEELMNVLGQWEKTPLFGEATAIALEFLEQTFASNQDFVHTLLSMEQRELFTVNVTSMSDFEKAAAADLEEKRLDNRVNQYFDGQETTPPATEIRKVREELRKIEDPLKLQVREMAVCLATHTPLPHCLPC